MLVFGIWNILENGDLLLGAESSGVGEPPTQCRIISTLFMNYWGFFVHIRNAKLLPHLLPHVHLTLNIC